MKIIPLHIDENRLVKRACKQDRAAQKAIYEKYSPKMLGVCRMYIKDMHFAEDVMLKAFFKAFKNLKQFRGDGSFEGWIRKITVREAIDFLRAKKRQGFLEEFREGDQPVAQDVFQFQETEDELQQHIDQLPEGYKTVLMLYAVEGYKHSEIAKMLGISENTSKSQLSKAREMLREKMKNPIPYPSFRVSVKL